VSVEHHDVPAEGAPAGSVPVVKEPETVFRKVRVRGEVLHLPVWSPEGKGWRFKGGEWERWSKYPLERDVVLGFRAWGTGVPLTSPFIEMIGDEEPDLAASVLTMAAVARYLSLPSDRAARQFVKRHGIPFSKVGRQYLVRREAIEEFVKEREQVFAGGAAGSAAMRANESDRHGPVKRAFARRDAEARHHGKA